MAAQMAIHSLVKNTFLEFPMPEGCEQIARSMQRCNSDGILWRQRSPGTPSFVEGGALLECCRESFAGRRKASSAGVRTPPSQQVVQLPLCRLAPEPKGPALRSTPTGTGTCSTPDLLAQLSDFSSRPEDSEGEEVRSNCALAGGLDVVDVAAAAAVLQAHCSAEEGGASAQSEGRLAEAEGQEQCRRSDEQSKGGGAEADEEAQLHQHNTTFASVSSACATALNEAEVDATAVDGISAYGGYAVQPWMQVEPWMQLVLFPGAAFYGLDWAPWAAQEPTPPNWGGDKDEPPAGQALRDACEIARAAAARHQGFIDAGMEDLSWRYGTAEGPQA